MNRRAVTRWQGFAIGLLWLVAGLLSLFVPLRREAPLPCCKIDGAHHCALRGLRLRSGGATAVLTVPCRTAPPKATGARLDALHPDLPAVRAHDPVGREVLRRPSDRAATAVVVARASRAPPRLV